MPRETPDSTAPYVPTEEEIAAACRRIQGWSEDERERRAAGKAAEVSIDMLPRLDHRVYRV